MAISTKEYLIKTSYDSVGLKQFQTDMQKVEAAATGLGASMSKSMKVASLTIKDFEKDGNKLRTVTAVLDDLGRKSKVVFTEMGGKLVENSASFTDFGSASIKAAGDIRNIIQPLTGLAAKLTEVNALNKGFTKNFGTAFKPATQVVEQLPSTTTQKQIKFNGADVTVPVEKISTVVTTADGSFAKLNQTITTLPNGMKQISRSMTDVTASYKKAEEEALRLTKANEQSVLSFSKVAVSSKQAESGARFFTTGLSKSATLLESNTRSMNKNGQEVLRTTAIFSDQGKKITTVFDSTSNSTSKVSQSFGALSEVTKKVDIDIGKLVSRAIVTIPVWLALRSAIMGVFTGIRDGVTNLVDFDLALQKVKRNLSGTSQEINTNFDSMKKKITEFSLQTGVSTENIASAIKEFATIGFSFEDSLAGGLDATRLSILLFGEAGDTAKSFASAMKLLVKEGEGVAPAQQQIAEAFALTAELAKNNKDDIGELSQGLNKFSATAKSANLSAKETITLLLTLATAGRSGAMSGTLLSTSFNNLLTNMDKVAKNFGLEFNPATDDAFSMLMKVLDASEKLASLPGGEIQVVEKLADVFGGERGTKVVSSLIAVNKILKENMKVTGDVARFNQDVGVVLDSESGQAQILGNSLKELGKSFVTSVIGADDFKDAIKRINKSVEDFKPVLNGIGEGFNAILSPTTLASAALYGIGVVAANTTGILAGMPTTIGAVRTAIAALYATASAPATAFVGLGLLINSITKGTSKELDDLDKKFQETQTKLASALGGKLPKAELEKFKIDFKSGKELLDVDIPIEIINAALDKALSKEEVAAQAKANIKISPEVTGKPEAIRSLENELNELKARLKAKGATDIQLSLLDISYLQSKDNIEVDKVRDAQSKVRIATIEKERSIQDILLQSVEDSAKAQGASNLQALTRRIELEKSLGIEKTGVDLLNQQLALQRALTEETKKTKQERINELNTLTNAANKKDKFTNGASTNFSETSAKVRANVAGISEDKINQILNPESQLNKANSLLSDLQSGLSDPMTKSMGSLEQTIQSLTDTIVKQEASGLGLAVPRTNAGGATNGGVGYGPAFGTEDPTATRPVQSIKDFRSTGTVLDVGGIAITVQGNSVEEVSENAAKMLKDMIAAELVKPGTKLNLSARALAEGI